MDNETKEITTKKGEFLLIRNFTGFFGILTSIFYFFSASLNVFASDDSYIRINGKTFHPTTLSFSLVFLLAGLGIIILVVKNFTAKKKRCTHSVTATVIDLQAHYDGNNPTYSPIYQFWFNGMDYTVTTDSSRIFALPKIGSQAKLHINPHTPTEFYCTSTKIETIIILAFGFGMICIGIKLFINFITSI